MSSLIINWRIGPVEWTRAGVVGLLRVGRWRFAMVGRLWRFVGRTPRPQ